MAAPAPSSWTPSQGVGACSYPRHAARIPRTRLRKVHPPGQGFFARDALPETPATPREPHMMCSIANRWACDSSLVAWRLVQSSNVSSKACTPHAGRLQPGRACASLEYGCRRDAPFSRQSLQLQPSHKQRSHNLMTLTCFPGHTMVYICMMVTRSLPWALLIRSSAAG